MRFESNMTRSTYSHIQIGASHKFHSLNSFHYATSVFGKLCLSKTLDHTFDTFSSSPTPLHIAPAVVYARREHMAAVVYARREHMAPTGCCAAAVAGDASGGRAAALAAAAGASAQGKVGGVGGRRDESEAGALNISPGPP